MGKLTGIQDALSAPRLPNRLSTPNNMNPPQMTSTSSNLLCDREGSSPSTEPGATEDDKQRCPSRRQSEGAPAPQNKKFQYSDLPDELKVLFLEVVLVSQTPIIDMRHNFPKAGRDVSLPAILQVDKLHRDVGGYLFYKQNTFPFSSQSIIEAFVDRYPHAAAQIEKLIIKMKIEHVSGEMNRTVTQNTTNRNGPWLSKLFQVQCLFQAKRMTTQCSNRISSYFKGIKELTTDIEDWKQMEEYEAHAGSNSALTSTAALFATVSSASANSTGTVTVSLDTMAANGTRQTSTHELEFDRGRVGRKFAVRVSQPVRVVEGAMIRDWTRWLVRGGWQASVVYITGAEDYPKQVKVKVLQRLLQGVF